MSDEKITVPQESPDGGGSLHHLRRVSGMYENWFLEYASYVILERAVPEALDGLKPVQRRILHAMKQLDDGRYNKVANIIGHTMQYHPHGDASIGDALVQLGQKELLIDCQGNWGNILTGDGAAASRYIEARLSKFALEVLFNAKTTTWKLSYDGRNREPLTLPVKFPLLLAQGVEGIAVGLASKILPHNFNELIDASIKHLKGESFELFPDFPTGGLADVSRYNDGRRGGKVRVRARISQYDKRTLVITEIPFGKTTGSLIDSILLANDKGKIKIRKVDDNTAENAEILVHLGPGALPDKTIDALYAFTDCEVSIAPNTCVIDSQKPCFPGVSDLLVASTRQTVVLLKQELLIRKAELDEAWHFSSLEKIFIENRIYNLIEDCETWEQIIETIDRGLDPFKKLLRREVTRDDITRLTEIKIKRISRFDSFQANEQIRKIEEESSDVQHDLEHLTEYAIAYYEEIKAKYGKGRHRRTELRNFDVIEAAVVVERNEKLYVNRDEGFAGYGLRKDEYVCDCADIDDIIVFRRDGTFVVMKVADKAFVGKGVLHIDVWKKNDDRTVYNAVYYDGGSGNCYIKRFTVTAMTRDKEYDLTQGAKNSRVLYFSANPNGEAETLKVTLKPRPRLRNLSFELDFSTIAIKNRAAMGNLLTKYGIHKIVMKEKGVSTLGGIKLWFDPVVMRLNTEERGDFVGEFFGEDKMLEIRKDGTCQLRHYDITLHFDDQLERIEKYNPDKVFTSVYRDSVQGYYYVKRFSVEASDKPQPILPEDETARLVALCDDKYPRLEMLFGGKDKRRGSEIIELAGFIGVKGIKAKGKRLSVYEISEVKFIEPIVSEADIEAFEKERDSLLINRDNDTESEADISQSSLSF